MWLIFGPNDTYFFDDKAGTRKWRAWPSFDKYMTSREVGEITTIAFGEDETFFINHKEGLLQDRNYMEDPKDHYGAFKSWAFFENVPHQRGSVAVCFGKAGKFFAKSSQGHRWRGIPDGAADYYQKFTRVDLFMKSRVNTIDFGWNNTYLGIGVDNTWFWDLGDEYTELSRLIGQKGINDCVSPSQKDIDTDFITLLIADITYQQWITINPFKPQQHFAAFADGTVHWALPASWIMDMQDVMKKYALQKGAKLPQSPQPQSPSPLSPPAYSAYAQPNYQQIYQDAFNNMSQQLNAALPRPSAPNLPPRPQPSPRPSQAYSSGNPPPAVTQQYVQSPGGGSTIDWNQYMQSTQDILNTYNNAIGAQTQQNQQTAQYWQNYVTGMATGQGGGSVSGGIDAVNNGINTVNNGLQIVNSLTDTGSMIGQLAGTAAACVVM